MVLIVGERGDSVGCGSGGGGVYESLEKGRKGDRENGFDLELLRCVCGCVGGFTGYQRCAEDKERDR